MNTLKRKLHSLQPSNQSNQNQQIQFDETEFYSYYINCIFMNTIYIEKYPELMKLFNQIFMLKLTKKQSFIEDYLMLSAIDNVSKSQIVIKHFQDQSNKNHLYRFLDAQHDNQLVLIAIQLIERFTV